MRIAIIGAGVIGVTSALALARRGHRVTIFDREGVAAGASRGNAGAFAFPDIIPLATPGIMRKAPRWFLDPQGPLSVPPAYALSIAPWLLRFWRASRPDRYEAALRAQAALMTLSQAAFERLVAAEGLEGELRREGQLQLYDSAASFEAARKGLEARRAAGIRLEPIEGAGAIAERQPGLAPGFTHAVYTPDWVNTLDPAGWVERLAEAARAQGVAVERHEIRALAPAEAGVDLVAAEGTRRFDRVVVAAGAWSERLTRGLGPRLPLDTERGYNTTLPPGSFDLRMQLSFADHGFVVSRVGEGIRVGGAVELGGLETPPRMSRARTLLAKAGRFLPELRTEGGTEWMGFRPSMPDSLPVIGAAPRDRRVLLAFGHGHLGLTQSAGTAEIIAALADGGAGPIDLTPYAPERFERGAA